mmetsp:Transcript_8182/g.16361  ORF Transcript_8182/g.16361 Transcript_8182/m.16361 type:complete len:263 (+) Transcript_8182:320-1108(+)
MVQVLVHLGEVVALVNQPPLGSLGEEREWPSTVPSKLALLRVDLALGLVAERQVPVHVRHLGVVSAEGGSHRCQSLRVPLDGVVELVHALERVADVVLGPRHRHVVIAIDFEFLLQRVLVLAQRLHVLPSDVVHVTHRVHNVCDVHVGLVRLDLGLEDLEGLLVQLVRFLRVRVQLALPLLLRTLRVDVLGLQLVGLARVHHRQRPVRVAALPVVVLLDVHCLLKRLQRLLRSTQTQERHPHQVHSVRDHRVQITQMVQLDG